MISRQHAALFLILSPVFCLHLQLTHAQNFTEIKPSPQQVEWLDLEFGVLIHYGPNSFMDREWGDGKADPKAFNPSELDAEQWMRAIKAAGAKYVVFVAKHHDGFCLWPTAQTDYSVKSSPWLNGKGDLVRQVSDAAKKYGLKFGVMNWFSITATWWNSGWTAPAAADTCTTFRASLMNSASTSQTRWFLPTSHCSNTEISAGWEMRMASSLMRTGM